MHKLLTSLVLAASLLVQGCDVQSSRVHRKRHVVNHSSLRVYYSPSNATYYGIDTSTGSYYRYSVPATSSSFATSDSTVRGGFGTSATVSGDVVRGGFGSTSQITETSRGFGLPAGGSWAQVSKSEFPEPEQLEVEPDLSAEINVGESGEILSDAEVASDLADNAAMDVSDAGSSSDPGSASEPSFSDGGGSGGDSGGSGCSN